MQAGAIVTIGRLILISSLTGILSACGGSNSTNLTPTSAPSTPTNPTAPNNPTVPNNPTTPGAPTGTLLPQFKGLGAGIITASDYPTINWNEFGLSTLFPLPLNPTSGTATYDGILVIGYEADDVNGYLGNTTLQADFNAGTIGGTAGEFAYYSFSSDPNDTSFPNLVRAVGGNLSVINGTIGSSSIGQSPFSEILADVSGTLIDAGTSLNVQGGLLGTLVDDNGVATVVLTGDPVANPAIGYQPTTIDDGSGPQPAELFIVAN